MAVLSSIPAVKNALHDRLSTRANLIAAGLLVSYGPPLPTAPGEFVWVGGVPPGSHSQKQVGAGPPPHKREEEYELEVIVSVLRQGRDQQGCTERAFALVAEVEDEIADDPTINGAVGAGGLAEVIGLAFAEPENDKAREANVLVRVHLHTFIGP